MPEGDVVWRTANRLHQALAGREVTVCDFRWPSLATVDLRTRTVLEVVACGKHLLIRCSGSPAVTVHSHLRMEGAWHLHRTGTSWRSPGPAAQIRAIIGHHQWTAVGYRLGELNVLATSDEDHIIGHLGPDLLSPNWDPVQALTNLNSKPEQAVGVALLDQRRLAGIGTVYLAECLFLGGVNPWTPVSAVPELSSVINRARHLLQVNVSRSVRATTGSTRRGESLWVYGRFRLPCRRCQTLVATGRLGTPPTDRIAYYCPRCQPPHP